MDGVRISTIATTPVKGLALHAREEVELGPAGVADNRCFYLIDERDVLLNAKRVDALSAVRAELDPAAATLRLRFPDGSDAIEGIEPGPAQPTRFFSRSPPAEPVCPGLSAALSDFCRRHVRLVRADPEATGNDRGRGGSVSLLSDGSLAHLSARAGEPVDPRRFRMLFGVEGVPAHGEDAWVGRQVRIGEATVRFHGHVGRCRITTLDPDSGAVTLATLDLLAYRSGLATTEPLAFGIYGEVTVPGAVRVGDVVDPG
ncbi:MOSC domain-containing protein [Conexibacter sp. DBS9H8]|uniref:MOSC domain-containing protein n=1 Tax=Conexibacter sp. DBS9H8 TaxID=2937801 RepID=UPI00200F82E5|nr:MOSC domain-containing protein [Conexibacter sp. DBS9H8]